MKGHGTLLGLALGLALAAQAGWAAAQDAHIMQGRIFDFPSSHPDFETRRGGPLVTGQVAGTLGADGRPAWTGQPGAVFSSREAFEQWYRDLPGLNASRPIQIELVETPQGSRNYVFEARDFFPIDGELLGDEGGQFRDLQGRPHNFHWTMRLAGEFSFLTDADAFTFTGDDDLWVFFGGQLGIDLGGVHPPASQTITGAQLRALGLQPATSYPIDIFFAERQTTGSNFGITTNFDIRPPNPERVLNLLVGGADGVDTDEPEVDEPALTLERGQRIEPGRLYALGGGGGDTLSLPESGNLSILGPDGTFRWGLNQVEDVDVTEVREVRASAASALEAISGAGEVIWSGAFRVGGRGLEVRDDSGAIVWAAGFRTNGAMPYRVVRTMVVSIPDVVELAALSDGGAGLAMTADGLSLAAGQGAPQLLRVVNLTEDMIGLVAASGPRAGEFLIALEGGFAFDPLINRSGVFVVRAPLASIDPGHVSLEALARPGMYMLSEGSRLALRHASTEAEPAVRDAATFRMTGTRLIAEVGPGAGMGAGVIPEGVPGADGRTGLAMAGDGAGVGGGGGGSPTDSPPAPPIGVEPAGEGAGSINERCIESDDPLQCSMDLARANGLPIGDDEGIPSDGEEAPMPGVEPAPSPAEAQAAGPAYLPIFSGSIIEPGVPYFDGTGGFALTQEADGNLVLGTRAGARVWSLVDLGVPFAPDTTLAVTDECQIVGSQGGETLFALGEGREPSGAALYISPEGTLDLAPPGEGGLCWSSAWDQGLGDGAVADAGDGTSNAAGGQADVDLPVRLRMLAYSINDQVRGAADASPDYYMDVDGGAGRIVEGYGIEFEVLRKQDADGLEVVAFRVASGTETGAFLTLYDNAAAFERGPDFGGVVAFIPRAPLEDEAPGDFVSLEAYDQRGQFIRHQGFDLKLDAAGPDAPSLLRRDATFRFQPTQDGEARLSDAPEIDETRLYQIGNAGFEPLGQDMCLDVFNGGELNDQLDMRDCGDYSGQHWKLTSMPTALSHLDTYKMTTAFRGDEMCLTIDGSLIDHVLRLAPCPDRPNDDQLWAVSAWKGEGARPDDTGPVLSWQIEPLLSINGERGAPMMLVVDTPPHGDGRPYVDAREYVGDGFIWRLDPR